jgi:hypothetical protein
MCLFDNNMHEHLIMGNTGSSVPNNQPKDELALSEYSFTPAENVAHVWQHTAMQNGAVSFSAPLCNTVKGSRIQ